MKGGCGRITAEKGDPSASTQISLPAESSAVMYVNQQLGFTTKLPLDRLGQVETEENRDAPLQGGGSCITVYHKQTFDCEGYGVLFTIDVYEGDWSAENPPVQAGSGTVVLKANGCAYLLRTPSDVQFCPEDEAFTKSNQALSAQLDELAKHFSAVS